MVGVNDSRLFMGDVQWRICRKRDPIIDANVLGTL